MFAIHSKNVLTPGGQKEAYVLIQNGVIQAVTERRADLPAHTTIEDFGDLCVMPGLIDVHVHINEPGRTEWEGFLTSTKAAIGGGVTTLIDMPLNSSPVTTTVAALEEKRAAAENKIYCDTGFWGGMIPGNQKQIEPLIKAGARGFKTFLAHSGIDDFPKTSEKELREVLPILAKHRLPLLVHTEIDSPNPAQEKLKADPSKYLNFLNSRPDHWETDAITLLIQLAKEFDSPIHIVHLSSAEALSMLEQAKKTLPITVETCPHYLFFEAQKIPNGDTRYKCAPPIRSHENRERLWAALKKGVIDFVVTDHSPCPPSLKYLDEGNFAKAWGGIASLGLALPIVWSEGQKRGVTPLNLLQWFCEGPAKLCSLSKKKGKIAPGFDADLMIFDPKARWKVSEDQIHFRHPITPYLGCELTGKIVRTYLRGKLVYDEGKCLDEPSGKLL